MSRVDTYLYIYQIYVSMPGVIEKWEDWKCQVNVSRFFSFYFLVFLLFSSYFHVSCLSGGDHATYPSFSIVDNTLQARLGPHDTTNGDI